MKQKINITIDEEIVEWAKKMVEKEHSNLSVFVNQILWEEKERGIRELITDNLSEAVKKFQPKFQELVEERKSEKNIEK